MDWRAKSDRLDRPSGWIVWNRTPLPSPLVWIWIVRLDQSSSSKPFTPAAIHAGRTPAKTNRFPSPHPFSPSLFPWFFLHSLPIPFPLPFPLIFSCMLMFFNLCMKLILTTFFPFLFFPLIRLWFLCSFPTLVVSVLLSYSLPAFPSHWNLPISTCLVFAMQQFPIPSLQSKKTNLLFYFVPLNQKKIFVRCRVNTSGPRRAKFAQCKRTWKCYLPYIDVAYLPYM